MPTSKAPALAGFPFGPVAVTVAGVIVILVRMVAVAVITIAVLAVTRVSRESVIPVAARETVRGKIG